MKIFLIRHGETTGDLEDRYGGDYEDHLTRKGREQAVELSRQLRDEDIEIIFSSPRIRAQETSQIMREGIRCRVELMGDLRERNAYGVLTGLTKSEAREKFPEEVDGLVDYRSNISGAETYQDLKARVKAAFDTLAAKPYGNIAVISHGGVIRCFVREILGAGELESLGDCAVLELGCEQGVFELLSLTNAVVEGRV